MSNRDTNNVDLTSTAENIENLLVALTGLTAFHHTDSSINELISLLVEQSENLNMIVSLSKAIPQQSLDMGLLNGLPFNVRPDFVIDSEYKTQ
ncbi:MAG: hypothetical protein HRU18_27620 [Pseudoalteromonas sp.]|uniref:hypothetical protein n=1 Tax=Pseudoalteromonas sp. TaxID=53249 RepID=UPI0007B92799|nr:hypothetical protein [Pseudoalteromonas sp.]KZY47780.1 hypothetical protein A3733_34820 [Pseudoalteromonas shioyasakiensis]KZY47789.1 hypothetical protein A3733_34795 [Pseudoalteromonas shioyasakiensis]NRA81983.1 hypothetical protein [Pseudoalteromonas sp.]